MAEPRWAAWLLDLLFPPKCVFCGAVLEDGDFCARCQEALPWTAPEDPPKVCAGLSRCESPLWYRDRVRESFHGYKFEGKPYRAGVYGTLMAQCAQDRLKGTWDLLTWVPLSPRRKKRRGYDQAYLLAEAAAKELGVPPPEAVLRKVRDVGAQSGLEEEQARRANISQAYEIIDPALAAGRRVLLVDDIVTTGSTLSECAGVLLAAGAADVVGLTLARARL